MEWVSWKREEFARLGVEAVQASRNVGAVDQAAGDGHGREAAVEAPVRDLAALGDVAGLGGVDAPEGPAAAAGAATGPRTSPNNSLAVRSGYRDCARLSRRILRAGFSGSDLFFWQPEEGCHSERAKRVEESRRAEAHPVCPTARFLASVAEATSLEMTTLLRLPEKTVTPDSARVQRLWRDAPRLARPAVAGALWREVLVDGVRPGG